MKEVIMQERAKRLREFSEAIATRRWKACPQSLYRFVYGLPSSVLLPMAAEQVGRLIPLFENRWSGVTWPREIVESTERWIGKFGRSLPDLPERNSVAEAGFVFCLDALLLGSSYPQDASVLTSSTVCAIRETIDICVQISAGNDVFKDDSMGACAGCDAASRHTPTPEPESPIEVARAREWQTVLDALVIRNLQSYAAAELPLQMEADLATWEDHDELLIVPNGATPLVFISR